MWYHAYYWAPLVWSEDGEAWPAWSAVDSVAAARDHCNKRIEYDRRAVTAKVVTDFDLSILYSEKALYHAYEEERIWRNLNHVDFAEEAARHAHAIEHQLVGFKNEQRQYRDYMSHYEKQSSQQNSKSSSTSRQPTRQVHPNVRNFILSYSYFH